jgi:succinate dehydrogenase / fumarate reductase cytochrome b subunit
MTVFSQIWRSSLGKKYIMGISGFILVAFILVHMMGNFQLFFPPYWINTYWEFLHARHELIWPARLFLLTMLGLHIWSAFRLRADNRAARPQGYAGNPRPFAATFASRTILMSGLIIGAFLVFHLLHFAFEVKAVNLTGIDFSDLRDEAGRPHLYLMLLLAFGQWPVAVFYVLAVGLLCLHLSHGMRAMFQSIGWNWTFGGVAHLPNLIAKWGAVFIFVIYSSIPVAVLCGYEHERGYKAKELDRIAKAQAAGKGAAK